MTTEEKAKRYDEAFDRARKINSGEGVEAPSGWTVCEVIFPELKESEDEKIRKELIDYHRSMAAAADDYVHEVWIDWLEKQSERKPADKAEPKFKVGNWVVQENIGVYKVIEICKSWYEVIDAEDNHYSISFDKEYMCHLWTIQYFKKLIIGTI